MRILRRILRTLRQRLSRLGRRRWTYRLPLDGIIFIVVTLAIGLAAMQTGTQLLYLVFGMLCAFWILSDVLATTSMSGVSVERQPVRLAVARQPAEVAIAVSNAKPALGSYSLRVGDALADGTPLGAVFVARLRARSRTIESYECVFPRRGRVTLARLSVATRFPFGLIERRWWIHQPSDIVILPPTVALDRLLDAMHPSLGEHELPRKGHGAGLFGLRPYAPGDSARDIHWKLTARTGTPVIREYESEERRIATVMLDNRLASDDDTTREEFEKAIVLAASLVKTLGDRGHQVELVTASGNVPFGAGSAHLTRCRRALALLEALSPTAPAPLPPIADADALRLEIAFAGNAHARPGTTVLHVADFDDLLAPAIGPLGPDDDIAPESRPAQQAPALGLAEVAS